MTTVTTGTLIDGVVKLDETLDLPNNSRVSVQITSIDETPATAAKAWENVKNRLKLRPIHSRGQRFTRDELHERR